MNLQSNTMDEVDGHVIMSEPQWQRLWEKSAIGTRIEGGGLKLFPEEVIFVHVHRHQPLPNDNWISNNLKHFQDLEDKFFLLEALRVPGNLIQLYPEHNVANGTWALRWHKEKHPDRDEPIAEIRWHRALDIIDMNELLLWTKNVLENNRIPEVMIIDDEASIVSYELSVANPNGNQTFNHSNDITRSHIGINTRFGIRINSIEQSLIQNEITSEHSIVLLDLINRGLVIRSGFKYGALWRGYETNVGEDHAPWLIDTAIEAPVNWTQACLNARLAAGVNKKYIIAIDYNSDINDIQYLEIRRPPSVRRWTNLTRH